MQEEEGEGMAALQVGERGDKAVEEEQSVVPGGRVRSVRRAMGQPWRRQWWMHHSVEEAGASGGSRRTARGSAAWGPSGRTRRVARRQRQCQ